ncbi:MAG: DUF222 domain-containing protein [Microthrixaceae bacterium]
MYEHSTQGNGAPDDDHSAASGAAGDLATDSGATGGADRLIDRAAPATNVAASLEAQLRADAGERLPGPDGAITEAEGRQLSDLTRELGGVLNATHGRMVLAVARVLETGWWLGPGILTIRQWLSIHWATSPAHANRVISVAKAAANYPAVIDALTEGAITIEAAHHICTRIAPEYQHTYAALARSMTLSQLRTCTRAIPATEPSSGSDTNGNRNGGEHMNGEGDTESGLGARPPEEDAGQGGATVPDPDAVGDDQHGPSNDPVTPMLGNRVSFGIGDDGRWNLAANLTAEDGALIETALHDCRDQLFRRAEDPDESGRITWADALVEIARRSLDAADAASAHGQPTDRTLIHYHLHYGRLFPEHGDDPIPDAVRRQLLCDSSLRVIGIADGRPVDLGRKTRVVTPRLRRIIVDRDRCCVVPGCGATRGLQIHHLRHWEDGGATDSDNLVALCGPHHRAHHHGLLHLHGDPNTGLTFTNADGRAIEAQAPIPPPNTTPGGLADAARRGGMAQPERGDFIGASGRRLDPACIYPHARDVPPTRPPDPLRARPHPPAVPPRPAGCSPPPAPPPRGA